MLSLSKKYFILTFPERLLSTGITVIVPTLPGHLPERVEVPEPAISKICLFKIGYLLARIPKSGPPLGNSRAVMQGCGEGNIGMLIFCKPKKNSPPSNSKLYQSGFPELDCSGRHTLKQSHGTGVSAQVIICFTFNFNDSYVVTDSFLAARAELRAFSYSPSFK